MTLNGVMAV